MELVYLWVEDYKNIYRQGFNFSPKFHCNYDPDSNELTIEENDDYIEDFFGDNINVTAIVGKNGSGKSSLLEILNNLDCSSRYRYIFFKNDTFYICFGKYCNISLNLKNNKIDFECLYYIEQNLNEINSVSSDLLDCNDSEPLKCKTLTIAEVLEYDNKSFDFINENFIFSYWSIRINTPLPKLNSGIKTLDDKYEFLEQLLSKESDNEVFLKIFTYVAIKLIKYIVSPNSLNNSKYWSLIENLSNDFSIKNYLELVGAINLEKFDNESYNLILETLQSFDISVENLKNFLNISSIDKEEIQNFIDSGIYKTFFYFAKNRFKHNIIDIDFLTKNLLRYTDLSQGQQQRIINTALVIDASRKCNTNVKLMLIDEPDTFLHPKWQKIIINDFTHILNKYKNNKLHLVLTTHSPFLLSDIPKQNIIFLDTDENGNCIVVDGLKEKKETFGANIHTLLSDSFFMEGGLMGEFAKGKINEIIDFYKQVEDENKRENSNLDSLKTEYEDKKKRFWDVQSIIGEEYLKQIIKNHLVEIEKILLGKDEAKKQEIERTKAYLEQLEND